MSLALICMDSKSIVIGCDSAISTKFNGETFRLHDDGEKIFIIENGLYFVSGQLDLTDLAIKQFQNSEDKSIESISNICRIIFNNCIELNPICKQSYNSGENNLLAVTVAKIIDGKANVIEIHPSNNFEPQYITVKTEGAMVLTASGYKTDEAYNIASSYLADGKAIVEAYYLTYKELLCEEIGGNIKLFQLNGNGITALSQINLSKYEMNVSRLTAEVFINQLTKHRINATTIKVGELNVANSMQIRNSNSSFIVDANGVSVRDMDLKITRSDNKGRIIMNATDGIKIQAANGAAWQDRLYLDGNGNVTMSGTIHAQSGTIG